MDPSLFNPPIVVQLSAPKLSSKWKTAQTGIKTVTAMNRWTRDAREAMSGRPTAGGVAPPDAPGTFQLETPKFRAGTQPRGVANATINKFRKSVRGFVRFKQNQSVPTLNATGASPQPSRPLPVESAGGATRTAKPPTVQLKCLEPSNPALQRRVKVSLQLDYFVGDRIGEGSGNSSDSAFG